MSQAAIPLHRQAIEDGLREFLDDASLQQAMDHWQRQYADQPSTALQRFVSDIYSAYDISASRATVLRSLLKAINLNGDALPGAPKSRRTGAPHNQRSEAFSLLIDAIMVQLEAEEQRRLLLEYFAALRKKHLPPGLLITLQSWLAKRDASAAPNADNAQLRFLLIVQAAVLGQLEIPVFQFLQGLADVELGQARLGDLFVQAFPGCELRQAFLLLVKNAR